MAKASFSVPSTLYTAATREVELPNLTTDDNGIRINFTRESWPVGTGILSGFIEGSNDNNATRFPLAPFTFDGGDQINPRTGQPVLSCGQLWTWPESYDSQGNAIPRRPGRVFVTVTNSVSLRTAITLTGA
jgi:hypothetical protein